MTIEEINSIDITNAPYLTKLEILKYARANIKEFEYVFWWKEDCNCSNSLKNIYEKVKKHINANDGNTK